MNFKFLLRIKFLLLFFIVSYTFGFGQNATNSNAFPGASASTPAYVYSSAIGPPAYRLFVGGAVRIFNTGNSGLSSASLYLINTSASGRKYFLNSDNAGSFRILDSAITIPRFIITGTGKTGIGMTAPTALLHLPAGTAAVNTAPLKFTSGVNLTTPEAGAFEYDGSSLYFTPSSGNRKTLAFADMSNAAGMLGIANGGTGQTTANASLNALLPSQTGNSGKVLKSNGTDALWMAETAVVNYWTATGNDIANNNTGNVAIGTSTAEQKLDVGGTLQIKRLTDATTSLIHTNSNSLQFQSSYWNGTASINTNWKINSEQNGISGINSSLFIRQDDGIPRLKLGYDGFYIYNRAGGEVFNYNNNSDRINTSAGIWSHDIYNTGILATTYLRGLNWNDSKIIMDNPWVLTYQATGDGGTDYTAHKFTVANAMTGVNSLLASWDNGSSSLISFSKSGNINFSGTLMPNNNAGTFGQVLTSAGPGAPPVWTNAGAGASQWITSGSNIFYNTGNVGIGTVTPSTALDINGTATINGGLLMKNAAPVQFWNAANNGYGSLGGFENGGFEFTTGAGKKISILNNGNIGIGTNSPRHLIDLARVGGDSQDDFIGFGVSNGPAIGSSSALGGGIVWQPNFAGYTKRSAGIVQTAEANNFRAGLAFFTNNANDATTDWLERMRIDKDGNVGIGTQTPASNLHIVGNSGVNVINPAAGPAEASKLTVGSSLGADRSMTLYYGNEGNVVWGPLTANLLANVGTTGGMNISVVANAPLNFGTNNSTRMSISATGHVGIGVANTFTEYKLAVAGGIIAEKVKVKLQSAVWPDYVFQPNYNLPSLKYVENFIKANNHLPAVPSAAEVQKNGIDLGDNQAVLLKKIEELTLYIIEQNKKTEQQQQQMDKLQQQLDQLNAFLKKAKQ
jgi:hypothetical protein